jgi:GntR family transcriptional regulator/MocR family aminotransferase
MDLEQNEDASDEPTLEFASRVGLDRASGQPLQKQLFQALRKQIIALELMPGQMLPSTRQLADQLDVSRTTVVRAYEDLLGQGYIKAIDGIGTFVSERPAVNKIIRYEGEAPASIRLSQYAKRLLRIENTLLSSADHPALNYGAAPLELLPIRQWRQILLKHCRDHKPTKQDYAVEPLGFFPLRKALADYLRRARALSCEPTQLAVFNGSLDAIKLISKLLIDAEDTIVVENPGFTFARKHFESMNAYIHAVAVDEEGIRIDQLINAPRKAKLLYVTPSHQDPTGAMMSLARRKQVLAWAEDNDTLIVEDDYDSEYRFIGSQIPALHALSTRENVIYLSSFWKTLHPLVDSSYLVVPPSLALVVAHAINLRETNASSLPLLEQYTLTDFIQDGHLERYIRKTHPVYLARWQAAVAALTKYLRNEVVIAKESAVMHLLIRFLPDLSDEVIVECAARADFSLVSLASYYHEDAPGGEFLMPFAHLNEVEIDTSVAQFGQILRAKTQGSNT